MSLAKYKVGDTVMSLYEGSEWEDTSWVLLNGDVGVVVRVTPDEIYEVRSSNRLFWLIAREQDIELYRVPRHSTDRVDIELAEYRDRVLARA